MNRILPVEDVPDSLWDASNGALQMPPILAPLYLNLLAENNLLTLASARDFENPPVGGLTQEATDKHLSQAFDGSVARAQLALLDPKNEISSVADMLIRCLSGNRLCMVDAPCGSGAASLAFLCCMAELRSQGVIPRVPLEVAIVGGEISAPARMYAERLLRESTDSLGDQAIFVSTQVHPWDVTDVMSNTNLIREMTLASQGRKTLVVVANFSGFLERDGKRKQAEPKLLELLRHAAVGSLEAGNGAVWIEPCTQKATSSGGTIRWVKNLAATLLKPFVSEVRSSDDNVLTTSATFQHLINTELRPRVNLAVQPLHLLRQDVGDPTT